MKNAKQTFHILSYLQYPLVILAMYFSTKPYLNGLDYMIENLNFVIKYYNYGLIFLGLAISFSTLQDTSKTSLKFEKKIWENPKKGKLFVIMISILTLISITFGIFGYFISMNENVKEISFGSIVFGIGLLGFLKTAIEVFENHRIDEKTTANNS